jgi:hypothetical protein
MEAQLLMLGHLYMYVCRMGELGILHYLEVVYMQKMVLEQQRVREMEMSS